MRRTALLLGILFALLLTALWFLFIISPMNNAIADLEVQLEAAENEEMTLRTTLARLKKIQESELAYIAAVGALDAMIPPSPDLADFVDQLNVLELETGVTWVSITPGPPSPPGEGGQTAPYLVIPVTISIEAQYFEMLGYLYGLADIDRLMIIDVVNIASTESAEGFTILNVQLTGRIFTTGTLGPLPPEEAPETEEAPEDTTTTTTTGG